MKRISISVTIVILAIFTSFFSGCSFSQKSTVQKFNKNKFTSKARKKSTMRCYTVRGKKYNPTFVEVGQEMRGISSWYGPDFHGKQTSNGEIYNMHAKNSST